MKSDSFFFRCVIGFILLLAGYAVEVAAADYTVTTTGNDIVVTDRAGNGDSFTVSDPIFDPLGLSDTELDRITAGKAFIGDASSRTPDGLNPSDWSSIRAAYEAGRHAVHPQPDGTLAARNPGQAWRTRFDGRGFTVTPDAGGWTWGLELQRFGFPGAQKSLAGGTAAVSHEQGRVSHEWPGGLREWFVNDTRGLEQGWTINERPNFRKVLDCGSPLPLSDADGLLSPGAQTSGHLRADQKRQRTGALQDADATSAASALNSQLSTPLTLDLTVRGGLIPRVTGDGASVSFVDGSGASALNFGGLKAWDADGRALAARFEVEKGQSAALRVMVDERDARYPITIDPIAQQAYLKASNTGANDWFGISVAVSGDTVVVGALQEDSSTTGVNSTPDESAIDAGAAYVFIRSGMTWTQQAYLKASNTGAGDNFGGSVAISGDTVVVGAYGEASSTTGVNSSPDELASFAGAAYVFTRSGTTWTEQAFLKASNTGANDFFGTSVAVSGDTVVVGAAFEDSSTTGVNSVPDEGASGSGAAYVFTRSGMTWTQQAYLKANNTGANDFFGYSVGLSGDTVVVGASGEASSTTGVNSTPNESAPDAGAAYVFTRSGMTWTEQAYLKASNTGASDRFGWSVAVSIDTVVVGAEREASSTTGVNSTPNENAFDAGAAYVFTRSGMTWTQQAYLKASNTGAGDDFGWSVAVSGDTVVVGAWREDSSTTGVNSTPNESADASGAAYVFTRSGVTWTQEAYLKASNTGAGDEFGYSVAVAGDTVVVGADKEASSTTGVNSTPNESALAAGAAYVFTGLGPVPDYTVTTTGGAIVVTDVSGNGDTLTVSEPSAGNIQFLAVGRTFSVDGGAPITGDSGILSRSGVTQITLNAGAGNDTINVGAFTGTLPSLSINGGTGDDTVNLNGDITFAADGNLDVDLQNDDATPGTDTVTLSNNANLLTSGTGTITIKCSQTVTLASGSSLVTEDGNLTVEANQQAAPTPGNFRGVSVQGLIQATGTGTVTVMGRGGDDVVGTQTGVEITVGGDIIGGTTGLLTVQGTGGASTGGSSRGVQIGGAGSTISSGGGSVQVIGQGGGAGASAGNIGVFLLDSGILVSAGGSGSVTVQGTGGLGSGSRGVFNGAQITSGGGNVQITGIEGPAAGSLAIRTQNPATFSTAANGGTITLIGNSMSFDTNGTISAPTNSSVTLRPFTSGVAINLGSATDPTGGPLSLSDAELDRITAGTIQIGDDNSGTITVSAAIAHATSSHFALTSGGDIILNPGSLSTGGGSLTLTPGASGSVQPITSGVEVNTSDNILVFGASTDLAIAINGTTVDTQYRRLDVAGLVNLTGVDLVLSGSYTPVPGNSFIIVNNDGADAITGAFNGLAEAGLVAFNTVQLRISYVGGDGNDAVLQPLAAPMITMQPVGTNVAPGTMVTFDVTANGVPPPTYQWRLNGVNLDGETNSTLTINNVQTVNAGSYSVGVANDVGAVNSAEISLKLNLPPLPMTNNFGDSVVVSDLMRLGSSSNVGATDEPPGEPNHAGRIGGVSMWITWMAPAMPGIVTFQTTGSSFDTLLAAYTGMSIGALTLVDSDEDGGGFYTSKIEFNTVPGTLYHIAVDGLAGAEGDIVLEWNFEATADTLPVITTQPQNQTVGLTSNATFSVVASGGGLTYQWFFNGNLIPGETASDLTVPNVQPANLGSYFVRVFSGPVRFVDSRMASLQISMVGVDQQVQDVATTDKFEDVLNPPLGTPFAGGKPKPVPRAASLVQGYTGTQIFSTSTSSRQAGEPQHCNVPGGASQWFSYVPPSSGNLHLNTDGSSFDTVLAVYTVPGPTLATLTPVMCDNNSGTNSQTSKLSFQATSGAAYYIAIDGVSGARGTVNLNYRLLVPLVLTNVVKTNATMCKFVVTATPSYNFTIQRSSNLVNWTTALTTNTASGAYNFIDANAPNGVNRFYRAIQTP